MSASGKFLGGELKIISIFDPFFWQSYILKSVVFFKYI